MANSRRKFVTGNHFPKFGGADVFLDYSCSETKVKPIIQNVSE